MDTTPAAQGGHPGSSLDPAPSSRLAGLARIVKEWPLARLRVDWFDSWHGDLDAALGVLPEMDTCPSDLYRELIETPGPLEKRTALVTRRGQPIAVIGLRRESSHWKPVTTWLIPGATVPVRDGFLLSALATLRVPIFVSWWRQEAPPPLNFLVESVASAPTHRLTCGEGFEAFWKQSGLTRDLEKARKRCAHLRLEMNQPGAAEWAIRNWARKWAPPGHPELPEAADRLAVAHYWSPRGRQITLSLHDGDRLVAADVSFAHRGEIVGMIHYRDPAYDKLSAGTRLIEAVHRWAAQAGFTKQDFGAGHDYKQRWAPEDGRRWEFTLRADTLDLRRLSKAALRRVSSSLPGAGLFHR